MNLELDIDSLVLHDFPAVDRQAVRAAVESELTRLVATRGVPPGLHSGMVARMEGGAFRVAADADAAAIGSQIAHKIYGGLFT